MNEHQLVGVGGGSTKQEFVHKIGCPIYTNIHILESNDVTGDICT